MNFKDLLGYQKAFPKEETYALMDQIRRSSRSTCSQIAEAYRKRRYPNHFISKLTDADAENAETQVWLDFALSCQYIDQEEHRDLHEQSLEIGKLIAFMIQNPEKFGVIGK